MSVTEGDIVLEKALYWAFKDKITYNKENENFVTYLKNEKEIFDRSRPKSQILIVSWIIAVLFLTLLNALLAASFIIFEFLQGDYAEAPGFQPEVYTIIMVATAIPAILGIALSIISLGFRYFFTKDKWSRFHDQTLALFERLQKKDLLNDFIVFEEYEGKKRFKLSKISVDFQFSWLFPFMFDSFPPLLNELLLLSFLLPFSISTILTILFNSELFILIFFTFILLLIFVGLYGSITAILKGWRTYHWIRISMINQQQELIHSLILEQADNLVILRNQNNLATLKTMSVFPVPGLIQFSAIIPLLGSFIGYLIGLTIIL
ncbi:MAG: hypothetical protein ACFFAJ_14345 [Candidatus Hodarchaeota archaeon]